MKPTTNPTTEARAALVATLRSAQSPWMHQAANEIEALAEDLAVLRIEHVAWGAIIDGLRASLATVTRERDEARQYIPAAQSCHRLADYMSTNRDLLDYNGCDMAGDGAIDVLGRLARERDELRAALLNERGEGEPPSEGWTWDVDSWVCTSDDVGNVYVYHVPAGWRWAADRVQGDHTVYNSARDAMLAADTALAGAKS